MRMSRLFLRTLRDDPSDAEVDSHRLLVRAGYIRKVSAGVYSWLPLGHRVLRKVEQIVREEMDAAGAQELLLPIIQPLEYWERTGRDQAYGPLMFKLVDRKETGFCLAPTAEEVITATVAGEYSSYRDLPVNLYQIGWKYRDELRPRFGLLRGREFLMKDAYSFDADVDGLRDTYQQMYDAYHRVFTRCGLSFRPVEAQAGEIGGDVNHEFMAVAAVGEDDFVWCRNCDYAANVEAAVRGPLKKVEGDGAAEPTPPMAAEHTPDMPGIKAVAEHLRVEPSAMLKCIAFDSGGALGLALVPGDREVNPYALNRALGGRQARLWDDTDFDARPDVPRGYIGPHFPGTAMVVADPAVVAEPGRGWVTGANRVDHHVRNAVAGRDFQVSAVADLATVVTGDPCPRCGGSLSVDRGIEVGHTFQLGTKYSKAMGAQYRDAQGEEHPMVMGCYGIGVSRVVAAVVEEHHDDAGLRWPDNLAPYDIHLISLPGKGEAAPEVVAAADRLYETLTGAGKAVIYDDRDASPGVKFADADLLGMPVQLVLGGKGLARGVVERKVRATGERDEIPLEDVAGLLV
ncbi:MAG: proline--tRNA ligase [Acidimicrobiia bacterium]